MFMHMHPSQLANCHDGRLKLEKLHSASEGNWTSLEKLLERGSAAMGQVITFENYIHRLIANRRTVHPFNCHS